VLNPSHEDREQADIDMFVSCSRDAIVMVEGGGKQMSEKDAIDALLFAHEQAQKIIDLQLEMRKERGLEKREVTPPERDKAFEEKVLAVAKPLVTAAYQ